MSPKPVLTDCGGPGQPPCPPDNAIAAPAPSLEGTKILGVSKTTAAGWLSFLITTLTIVLAFQLPAALMTPGASRTWLYIQAGGTLALSLCRAWVGLLSGDAPKDPGNK